MSCCRKIEALVFLLANSMIVRQGMFFNYEKRRHARKCVIWPTLGTSFSTNRHIHGHGYVMCIVYVVIIYVLYVSHSGFVPWFLPISEAVAMGEGHEWRAFM